MTTTRGDDDGSLVRHGEELRIGTHAYRAGTVRARKSVETHPVEHDVSRLVEEADVASAPVGPEDSGEIETLPDGSVSIPVLEEQLVVTKRLVVRERIVIRKSARTEREVIRAELRKERVAIETEGDIEVDDTALEDDAVNER